jgi:uncharacterized lipoprotein YajG
MIKMLKVLVLTAALLMASGCAAQSISKPQPCDPVQPLWSEIQENKDGTLTLTPEQIEALLNYIESLEACNYA